MGKNIIEVIDGITNLKIVSKTYGEFYSKIDDWIVEYIDEIRWGIQYNPSGAPGRKYYVKSKINGKMTMLHEYITVLHANGKMIDHTLDPLDNRIASLRYVTHQENQWNRPTSKGYSFYRRYNKYKARIRKDGKDIYLGCFDTSEEARNAYLSAKLEHHIIQHDPAISRFYQPDLPLTPQAIEIAPLIRAGQ